MVAWRSLRCRPVQTLARVKLNGEVSEVSRLHPAHHADCDAPDCKCVCHTHQNMVRS